GGRLGLPCGGVGSAMHWSWHGRAEDAGSIHEAGGARWRLDAVRGQFACLLAQRIGIYDKYGLSVDYTIFNDDGAVASAMLSGQVDMSTAGAALIINSRLTDTPAKDLAVQKTKVIDGLFCGSTI